MQVDINTRFITLIGKPLGQSFAARMQNAGYKSSEYNMVYFYTEADNEHLGEIINGIRYMPAFAGCAVTKPNTAVVEELRGVAPKFFAVGNCVRPDTITHAVYQGYHAALNI